MLLDHGKEVVAEPEGVHLKTARHLILGRPLVDQLPRHSELLNLPHQGRADDDRGLIAHVAIEEGECVMAAASSLRRAASTTW